MEYSIIADRVSKIDSNQLIGLYPINQTCERLFEQFKNLKKIKLLDGQSKNLDVIVICSDLDKVSDLIKIRSFFEGSNAPSIIMAGTDHMFENKLFADNFLKNLVIESSATGYDLVQTHLYESLKMISNLGKPGHVIELGTYRGGTITFLYELAKNIGSSSNLEFTGFDAWDGKKYKSDFLDLFDMPEWIGNNFENIREVVPKDINLVRGEISGSFPNWISNQSKPILLAFIDTDNYSPIASTLPLIWDKLANNGVVVFDHYFTKEEYFNTIGEHIAAREFFKDRTDFLNLTGTGVFIKINK